MDIFLPNEKLTSDIKSFASVAVEYRQVAYRLRDLLPTRFFDIKRHHLRHLRSAARAERKALIDQDLESHIDELVNVSFHALRSKIQYETHLMLFQARQTLRTLTKR